MTASTNKTKVPSGGYRHGKRVKKAEVFTNLLNYGTNSKLGDRVAGFSLPALKTCTPSDWCRKYCYAIRGMFNWPMIKRKYQWCWEESQKDTFVSKVVNELEHKGGGFKVKDVKANKYKWIRVHPAGDFYSPEYVQKWLTIAEHFPNRNFLAYTKRGDLKNSIYKLASLDNFTVLESLDESMKGRSLPKLQYAVVTGTKWDAGASHECPGACPLCGYKCWYNKSCVFREIVGQDKKPKKVS